MSERPGRDLGDTTDRQFDCPRCEAELDAEANFCANCGVDVSAIESSSERCPDCGTAVAATDNFCFSCGATLSDHQGPTNEQQSFEDAIAALNSESNESNGVPESLTLSFDGYEISVSDGDTVGSEVRAALSEAGRPDTEVIRIHREHVRFIRRRDSFYLLDLGDNPTHLNGHPLSKGDRRSVSPGDELELSGVAAITVQTP